MLRSIHLTSASITKLLLCIIFVLSVLNVSIIYLHFVKGYHYLKGFIHAFYFDTEANFPSLYSSVAILFVSVLLWQIGGLKIEKQKHTSRYWKLLSIVFGFLAVDEFIGIHEYLIKPSKVILSNFRMNSDYFYFAWFLPYLLLFLIVALFLTKFVLTLPPFAIKHFIIAAVIFLSGAVGMEMVGGKHWAEQGWSIDGTDKVNLQYAMIITVEEFLEMIGIVVFIHGLTSYLLKNEGSFQVLFTVSSSRIGTGGTEATNPSIYNTPHKASVFEDDLH